MAADPGIDPALEWRKSRSSGESQGCVEVAKRGSSLLVRDSRDRSGALLSFGPAQWADFLARIRGAAREPRELGESNVAPP
jgi:Domain of unknown function (DUF397)